MGVPNLSFRNPKQPHCLWDFLCGQESKPILPPYKPRWYCFRIWHDTMIHITSKSKKKKLNHTYVNSFFMGLITRSGVCKIIV